VKIGAGGTFNVRNKAGTTASSAVVSSVVSGIK
jgi:hypothetical protein